jgi:hypothetical protein
MNMRLLYGSRSTLIVRELVYLGLFDSSGFFCSHVTFETQEQHRCWHEPRKCHHQRTQTTGQELVQIPASTTLIRMDECRPPSASYQWIGRINHERNADADLLEQVH